MNKATRNFIKAICLFAAICILGIQKIYSQTPAKCLEIESILVDACVPGGGACSTNIDCPGGGAPICPQGIFYL